MKKILYYGIGSNLGGIETYVTKIINNIDRNKYHIDFAVLGNKIFPGGEKLEQMGCKIFYIPSRKQNPIKNIVSLYKLIKHESYDIIHCHILSLSYLIPAYVGIFLGVPVIIHSHSSSSPKSFFTKLLHYFNKFVIRFFETTNIAVSNPAALWTFSNMNEVMIVNNGIDVEEYTFNKISRKRIREELTLAGQFVVIHIGAFKKVKNHEYLLEVFREIITKRRNSKLLLVGGDGDCKDEILKLVKRLGLENNVIFLGVRNDINVLLSASDLLIFPSLYEGFPNVVLEAQTNGLPCLISDKITDEVIINPNCQSLSINLEPSQWADVAMNLNCLNDRTDAIKSVYNRNLDVKSEIRKIEDIYRRL